MDHFFPSPSEAIELGVSLCEGVESGVGSSTGRSRCSGEATNANAFLEKRKC